MATSEREKELNVKRLSEGRWPFGIPYGYREGTGVIVNIHHKNGDKLRLRRQVVRSIVIDSEPAAIVQRLFELYASSSHPIAEIKRIILKEFNTRMHFSMLYRILSNPFYTGRMEYDGVMYRHDYGTIVSIDTFKEAQFKRNINSAHKAGTLKRRTFPFKKILRCGFCNGNITADIKKERYVYYKCTLSKQYHPFKAVRYEKLIEYIAHRLILLTPSMKFIDKFSEEVQKDIRWFRDKVFELFVAGQDGQRNAIAECVFSKIAMHSFEDEITFTSEFNKIWDDDVLPHVFVNSFYKAYWWCVDKDRPVAPVENPKIKLTFSEKILRMCINPKSLDELMDAYGVSLEEVQNAIFDLQLDGRIQQDGGGRWITVR